MAVLPLTIIHILSVSLWMAALVVLPLVLMHTRAATPRPGLRAAARDAYLFLLSPAAFAGILSGLALAGLSRGDTDWYAVKLWLVAGLALMHILVARQVGAAFGATPAPTRNLLRASSSVSAGLALSVLVTVLAEPARPHPGTCTHRGTSRQLAQMPLVLSFCGGTAGSAG